MPPDPDTGEQGSGAALPAGDHEATRPVEQVIPLAGEVLRVDKRTVEAGRIRVTVATETAEEIVRETLRTRRAEIERVTLGHEIREVPQTREEDGVLVIPVVEEILVIEKRLVLKEEIRLRFVDTEDTVEQAVERRVQRATVERMPPSEETTEVVPGPVIVNGNSEETTS